MVKRTLGHGRKCALQCQNSEAGPRTKCVIPANALHCVALQHPLKLVIPCGSTADASSSHDTPRRRVKALVWYVHEEPPAQPRHHLAHGCLYEAREA